MLDRVKSSGVRQSKFYKWVSDSPVLALPSRWLGFEWFVWETFKKIKIFTIFLDLRKIKKIKEIVERRIFR